MSRNKQSIIRLAELVRVLPLADQVELLRMLAPSIMAELDEEDRADLITAINEAIIHHALHSS